MKKSSIVILSLFTGVTILIIIIIIAKNWDKIEPTFFSLSIADIINIIVTIFIGILVTYIFNVLFSKNQKRNEIILSIIEMYLKDLRRTIKHIHEVWEKKELQNPEKFNRELTHFLKMASNDLNSMINACEECQRKKGGDLDEFKNDFFTFKSLLTASNFNEIQDVFDKYSDILSEYYIIKSKIHSLKLSLYR